MDVASGLQGYFEAFTKRNKDLEFFKGLGEYLEYIYLDQRLKLSFEKQLLKREKAYREYVDPASFERDRQLNQWGNFGKLDIFHRAVIAVKENRSSKDLFLSKEASQVENQAEANDFLDICYLVEELRILLGEKNSQFSIFQPHANTARKMLDRKEFLPVVESVHNFLIYQSRDQVEGPRENALDNDLIEIPVQNGCLTINRSTGTVSLNNVKKDLNPSAKEYRILLKLAINKDHIATYSELLDGGVTKSAKRTLTFVIRNIKECLGILPKKGAKNKDIIQNIKFYGYKLK